MDRAKKDEYDKLPTAQLRRKIFEWGADHEYGKYAKEVLLDRKMHQSEWGSLATWMALAALLIAGTALYLQFTDRLDRQKAPQSNADADATSLTKPLLTDLPPAFPEGLGAARNSEQKIEPLEDSSQPPEQIPSAKPGTPNGSVPH